MLKLALIPLLVLLISSFYFYKNTTIFAGLRFSQATVAIPQNLDAVYYNIYYKSQSEQSFTNAVGKIPKVATAYTITYLKKGVGYEYYETYVDKAGIEHQLIPISLIQGLQSMN